MNEKFYIAFNNNNIKRKIIFLLTTEEKKTNDCWYLIESDSVPSWLQCRMVFKEVDYFEISRKNYLRLRKLNDWERHQINKFFYYIDLFKYWGIYEELCEGLI